MAILYPNRNSEELRGVWVVPGSFMGNGEGSRFTMWVETVSREESAMTHQSGR